MGRVLSAPRVRDFLARHGLSARKDLGQSFLVDEGVADRLAALAGVAGDDAVIEIGTGLGILTRALARRARRVISLEVDAGLVRALRAEATLPESVELLHGDALRVDLGRLAEEAGPPVRLVANLPYSISGPLLRRLLDLRGQLLDWSVMVQRELADRLLAAPGSRAYGSLTVLHRLTVRLERTMDLSPRCFFPAPEVRSAFVRMTPLEKPLVRADELADTERVVRAAFSKRRKTLANALREAAPGLPEVRGGPGGDTRERFLAAIAAAGIDPRARAESLAPETLLELARRLRAGED